MGLGLRWLATRTLFLCDASIALMTSVLPLFLSEDWSWIHCTNLPAILYRWSRKKATFPDHGWRIRKRQLVAAEAMRV